MDRMQSPAYEVLRASSRRVLRLVLNEIVRQGGACDDLRRHAGADRQSARLSACDGGNTRAGVGQRRAVSEAVLDQHLGRLAHGNEARCGGAVGLGARSQNAGAAAAATGLG